MGGLLTGEPPGSDPERRARGRRLTKQATILLLIAWLFLIWWTEY